MKVTLLGTGGSAGVPMIGGSDGRGDWGECDRNETRNVRTRASIVIDDGAGALLVDTTPDMRGQMLAHGVSRVDAILYTHAHADHIMGLDDVRLLNRMMKKPLEAFGTKVTLDEIEARFGYAFRPWKPPSFFRPVLHRREIAPGDRFEAAGMEVAVFDQDHGFVRSLGVRVGKFAYSTDVVGIDDAGFEMLAGIDTWVVDCFQRDHHHTHAWLGRIIDWSARLKPRRVVLTHMGVDMDWSWLVQNLPPGIEPGHDGQVLEIT